MTDRVDLARVLALVAGDLDRRGYPAAGIVRAGARALLTDATPPTPPTGRCRGCGAELPAPARGRRRTWCSETCRRRHRT